MNGTTDKTLSLQAEPAGDLTFLVTIKPSPPTKRKMYDKSNSSPERTPSPPTQKNFGQVFQDIIEQITAPAEKELEDQMTRCKQPWRSELLRHSSDALSQVVRQKQGVEHAASVQQKHMVHYAHPLHQQDPYTKQSGYSPAHSGNSKYANEPAPYSFPVSENSGRQSKLNHTRRNASPPKNPGPTSSLLIRSESPRPIPPPRQDIPLRDKYSSQNLSPRTNPYISCNNYPNNICSNSAFDYEYTPNTYDYCKPLNPFEAFNQSNGFSSQYEELQEKIRRLERDKETLTLQVSVLNEQIEAQNEKIRDTEAIIQERRERADRTEELLQKEIALRSSLENTKLDLMAEITSLKLRVSDLEKDKRDLQEKLKKPDVNSRDTHHMWMNSADQDDVFLNSLPGRRSKTPTLDSSKHLKLGVNELEKMKRALESVMAANDEKDRKIEELRSTMMRYKRMQERMSQNKKDEIDLSDPNTWNFSSSPSELTKLSPSKDKWIEKPPPAPRPIASSTPIQTKQDQYAYDQLSLQSNSGRRSISPTPHKLYETSGSVQSSQESISRPPKTPPSRSRAAVDHYGTVPRNYAPLLQAETSQTLPASTATPSRLKTSFGKGFLKFKSGSRSSSAPNLAHTEIIPLPTQEKQGTNTDLSKQKNKGIKKIFGKLKRSNSQTMESEITPGEFQRGGMRATAGPRLGWSRNLKGDKDAIDVPFARWDTDEIVAWFHELGLNSYITECRRWIRNGDQLLKASAADLEKELGMKNPLHRKKLTLALQAIGSNEHSDLATLDHYWVLRWLDDVGLPQYKDSFNDARVDGRMLHYLSVDDLIHLKISSLLHVTSLRRGIEVLRLNQFDGNCLRRRSTPQEKNPPSISEVALWTNHRVMEWLRSVDLSEYAPNLRGSGVHGALMVLEPRFTAELLATLLSIPPNKTLLRRHLNTHFKELVGPFVMQQKREKETETSYSPLMPSLKIKITKKSQFSLMKKRNKAEMDLDDYICPFDDNSAKLLSNMIGVYEPMQALNSYQRETPQSNSSSEHQEKDKKAVQEIGAVSKEINCLTDMLQNERLFASMATSNV